MSYRPLLLSLREPLLAGMIVYSYQSLVLITPFLLEPSLRQVLESVLLP